MASPMTPIMDATSGDLAEALRQRLLGSNCVSLTDKVIDELQHLLDLEKAERAASAVTRRVYRQLTRCS
jgi:hypothetical protein